MDLPITSLLISKQEIERLQGIGYTYYEKSDGSTDDIPEEIGRESVSFELKSAVDFWLRESNLKRIPCHCISLDKNIGGGFSHGTITEISGLPGSGKTQLCMQLCASVLCPITPGMEESEAVYIDSAANFTAERFQEILIATVNRNKESYVSNNQKLPDLSTCLKKVHYIEALGSAKFCAAIHLLKSLIKNNKKISLIIIDSISFPFKDGCEEIVRTGILYRTMATLRKIVKENKTTAVLCNEMSSRAHVNGGAFGGLGDAWAHCISNRILLTCNHAIVSSSSRPPQTIAIKINTEGLRDQCVDGEEEKQS